MRNFQDYTESEEDLIGLSQGEGLPNGGINFKIYSFSGYNHDSNEGWTDVGHSVKTTLRNTFNVDFCPGSLNVRLTEGVPWTLPESLNPQRINLGVVWLTYVLPVVLNEKCIGVLSALNVTGFDYATGEKIPEVKLNDKTEAHHIYSPVNIRERLGITDVTQSDDVVINARLLPGSLLTIYPTVSRYRLDIEG